MTSQSDLNREISNSVQTAYIFDVDGVITDPKEKKVTQPQIIDLIIHEIEKGNFLAFNSGRNTNWVKKMVIEPLTDKIVDKKLLEDVIAVGEKGTSILKYNDGWHEEIDKKYSFPDELKESLRKFALTTKSMFYDENKHNMATLEMKDGYDIDEFVKERDSLLPEVKKLVSKYKDIVAEPTSIDIDIQHKDSGKHLGARHILDWLKSKNLNPNHFVTVGDSLSDLEMADELNSQGKSVEFWYVNPNKKLDANKLYPIKTSSKEFSEGTVEMLNAFTSN